MITVKEFCSLPYSNGVAYVLGLVYPLFKVQELTAGSRCQSYLIGSVNHNPGHITHEDLKNHHLSVSELLRPIDSGLIYDNSVYHITRKQGFSVILAIGDSTESASKVLISEKVKGLQCQGLETKKYFVRGCFDGRSSFDKTTGMLAIDVDRDITKQNIIYEIALSIGIDLNLNQRGSGHPKNDQIRVKKSSLAKYNSKIGFYSTYRERQCKKGTL